MKKICSQCNEEKEWEEFYGGRKCKECTKKNVRERYSRLMATDPEWAIKELDRQKEKSRRARESGRVKPFNPEMRRIVLLKSQSKNPLQRKATSAVSNAIRDGHLLKQPCEVCGHPVVQAHHDDYSKPLDVRWLCVQHHNEHHIQERRKKVLERFQNSNGSLQQPSSQNLK